MRWVCFFRCDCRNINASLEAEWKDLGRLQLEKFAKSFLKCLGTAESLEAAVTKAVANSEWKTPLDEYLREIRATVGYRGWMALFVKTASGRGRFITPMLVLVCYRRVLVDGSCGTGRIKSCRPLKIL